MGLASWMHQHSTTFHVGSINPELQCRSIVLCSVQILRLILKAVVDTADILSK